MTLVVPDASVLVKWVLAAPDEGDLPAALALRDSALSGDVVAAVPGLWLYEVANVLCRRVPDRAADMLRALRDFDLQEEVATDAWLDTALRLVADYRVTFYDAAYHALALVLGGILVTADARYVRTAGAAGSVTSLAEWRMSNLT